MIFSRRAALLLILMVTSVLCLFSKLHEGNLPSWDDAYYAQKAKEMLNSGDLWTSTIAGKPRFDNPPAFFWAIAASYKVFGVNEFGARFPSALAAVLGIFGVLFLFELLFGTRVGFLAALILNFTTVYLKYGRHCMIDVSVAAAGVWCFYFFWRGLKQPNLLLVAGAVGSYIMASKSLFGALPLVVLFLHLVITRSWWVFAWWQLWAALALYVAPYTVWALVEQARHGAAFVDAHFIKLMFNLARAKSSNDNVWDYLVVLLKYFPVFLPFMIYGIWLAFKSKDAQRASFLFALNFFFTFFILLSIQGTTKTWYFIPALPACAGLAALGLDRVLKKVSLESIGRVAAGLALALFLIFHLTPVRLGSPRAVDIRRLAPYVRAAGDQGFKLFALKQDYFGLNNSLLFYSDQAATVIQENDLLELAKQQRVVVLMSPLDLATAQEINPQLQVVRRTGELVMTSDEPLNQEEIYQ